ncbi:MAG: hypothetical protein E7231_04400 [Cellulosilyticum sp.]|nr:hypothetical protein [Cellulosilyticum sp.]
MSYIYPTLVKDVTKYKTYFLYETTKIYLGMYTSYDAAETAIKDAKALMSASQSPPQFDDYSLDYRKVVSLCNLRDNKRYIKNPIYLYPTYFTYYLSKEHILTFDLRDLLYFSTYKIYKRGNYLYTQDAISQQSILSRYGIPNHSVINKDYIFKNNDPYDFRQSNLEIINGYKGVTKKIKNGIETYTAHIYIKTDFIIGHYASEFEAAIAYNKAVDILSEHNMIKDYTHNTIPFITKAEYDSIYNNLILSPRIYHLNHTRKRVISQKQLRGVSKDQNSYKAYIGYQGKQLYLGMYPTEKRAAQAYNYASFYLFGRQGYINEVSPLIYDGDMEKIIHFLSKYQVLKKIHEAN